MKLIKKPAVATMTKPVPAKNPVQQKAAERLEAAKKKAQEAAGKKAAVTPAKTAKKEKAEKEEKPVKPPMKTLSEIFGIGDKNQDMKDRVVELVTNNIIDKADMKKLKERVEKANAELVEILRAYDQPGARVGYHEVEFEEGARDVLVKAKVLEFMSAEEFKGCYKKGKTFTTVRYRDTRAKEKDGEDEDDE